MFSLVNASKHLHAILRTHSTGHAPNSKSMKRKDGFTGQMAVNIPGSVLQEVSNNKYIESLHPVDIGYYPVASYHYREREKGCAEYILIYCVGGKGWFWFNNQKHIVSPGTFFVLPPDKGHQYGADKSDPWSIYWVHFAGSNADTFFANEPGTLLSVAQMESDEYADLFSETIVTLNSGVSDENIAYACGCLHHLLSMFKYGHILDRNKHPHPSDVLEQTIVFMKNNLHRRLVLNEVAAASGLSVSHFSSLFRQKTNRSPMEYFMFLKIQRACHLLNNGNLRIKEVSQMLGFDDPFYFSRLFTKVMLVSPSDYRKQRKG